MAWSVCVKVKVNILSRVVAKDIRSTTGRNLRMLERETWMGTYLVRTSREDQG